MKLVYTGGTIELNELLPEPTHDTGFALTLDGPRVVGDGRAVPRPMRIPCVAYGSLDAVHSHLITLGVALRTAIQLEWPTALGTYVRPLRPGGTLTVRTARGGVVRYELELLPDAHTWIAPDGSRVIFWH